MVLGSSPRVGTKPKNYKQQKSIHFKDEARVRIPYVVNYYIGLVVRMRKNIVWHPLPYGLVVRITGFHPVGRGSIPRGGKTLVAQR